MEEQMEQVENKTSTLSKSTGFASGAYEGLHLRGPSGLAAAMAAELMIGFWFGIGVILAVKMVQSLEHCIEELINRK